MKHSLPKNQSSKPTQEQIAAAAYQLYLDSGSTPGNDLQNWLMAEQMLAKGTQAAGRQRAPSPKTAAEEQPDQAPGHDGNGFHSRLTGSDTIQPLLDRDNPQARNERNTASREEIRHIGIPPAARQSQRRTERSRAAGH